MGGEPELRLSPLLPVGVADAARAVAAAIDRGGGSNEVLRGLAALGAARLESHDSARALGAVYTPFDVAAELVDFVDVGVADRVFDPSVGGGVFLLAAAERQRERGADVAALTANLAGADVDPVSVAVTTTVLGLWARWRYGAWEDFDGVVVGDVLGESGGASGSFDVVVGNPPFLGQLRGDTSRSRDRAEQLKARFGEAGGSYVDDCVLFLAAGADLVGPGGRVCLLTPASVLGSASSAPARRTLEDRLGLDGLWIGGVGLFEGANVDVVAPRLGRSTGRVDVRHRNEGSGASVPSVGAEWQELFAAVAGVPPVDASSMERLGSMATATADFRDSYYWLAERVSDAASAAGAQPIATVGLIDPLHFRHGAAPVRFAKQRYDAPVATFGGDSEAAEAWRLKRSVPKVMVATQTRTVECVVDVEGTVLPSTPVISVTPDDPGDLFMVAAALTSPFVSAWAATVAGGTGRSSATFRLRASQLLGAPLPVDRTQWERGADLAEAIHCVGTVTGPASDQMRDLGEIMNAAYGRAGDTELLEWWLDLLPIRR